MNVGNTRNRSMLWLVSLTAVLVVIFALAGMARSATASPGASPIAQDATATPAPAAEQPLDAGPLVGDQSVFAQEVKCMEQLVTDPANNLLNYWPAIGAPEHTDSIHSGVNPCATFTGVFTVTGSYTETNQVFQHVSETNFGDIQFIVFDGPNAGYLQGGGLGAPSSGQFVAKFNPSTGKEIWRTYLTNVNVTGQWIAFGSIAIIKDGTIIAAAGPNIWKLDRATGDILAYNQLPVLGGMPPTDANWDGMQVAPDDVGTILLKSQTRPAGCPTQGNAAMSSCVAEYGPQPNTTVVAVNPETLEAFDAILLDQEVTARPIVTTHNDTIYMYMAGTTTLQRIIWDPDAKKLTADSTWAPEYLLEGQAVGDAPALLGDWVVANTNAAPSTTMPGSVVAVNQDDPTKLVRLNPWGTTFPEGVTVSESPASFGVDPANNMIFVQDWLVGGVFGISLDQATGAMEVVWSRPDWRNNDYFSLVGPADQRVLVSQYINPDFTMDDLKGYNYTESVLWANALTGETIAQSAYNASTAPGSLPNIGYGGRVYMMGNTGSIYIYQVMPYAAPAPAPTATPSS